MRLFHAVFGCVSVSIISFLHFTETIELVFLVVEALDDLSMSGHCSFEFYLISPSLIMRTAALVT